MPPGLAIFRSRHAGAAAKAEGERTQLNQVTMLELYAFDSDRRVIDPATRCAVKIHEAEFPIGKSAQLAVHCFHSRVFQNQVAQVGVAPQDANLVGDCDGFIRRRQVF